MAVNLWGIEIPDNTKKVLKKSKPKKTSVKKVLNSKKTTLEQKLNLITENVHKILGVYKENTIVIKSIEEFKEYIDKSIENGIIAIDTETNNSLDPLTCKIMGLCLYTPNMKNAYIPINHRNYITKEKYEWQVTEVQVKEQLDRLKNTKIIMHNAKFDYQVIKCTCDCILECYWDTFIASKVLDENEKAGLKQQYINKIDPSIEKYSIEQLFTNVEYADVSPEIFALYSATDSYMTYKLYKWQVNQFNKKENKNLYSLFKNIEMPVIKVTAEMELTGVCLDLEYTERLSKKYQEKNKTIDTKIENELLKYKTQIDNWRITPEANKHKIVNGKSQKSKNEQLTNPINVGSSTQLAILLYDILKVPIIDKSKPRGTGEPILKKINLPIVKLILEKRGLQKLINTYIDKLPDCLSTKDNRLHASFLQYGAGTGRFSSKNPNLQNIPSHNNEIRMMFKASDGYVMIGGDYSQQEPRLLSHYSQDKNMINAYKQGKDLYAMIASKVYNNNYEDNLEFNPITKKMSADGKKRRTSVKGLLLGIMYGMGTGSIASMLKCSWKEAEEIKSSFFKQFPKVEKWINETQKNAKKDGFVEDVWGRRRRLPDLLLDKYEINTYNNNSQFNPILYTENLINNQNDKIIKSFKNQLDKCKSKEDVYNISKKIKEVGLKFKNNSGFIAQAERQCVNARIQGGAASMSKRAMVNVYNNEELKNLGFKLLIVVHDEIIGECPIENKERCKELLSECMLKSALPEVNVPMKCDCDDFSHWYLDVYTTEIQKEYKENGNDFEKLYENHKECTYEQLEKMIKNG